MIIKLIKQLMKALICFMERESMSETRCHMLKKRLNSFSNEVINLSETNLSKSW